YNPLDFDADMPIFAWDRSPDARAEAIAAYPDRPVWIVKGPTMTGRGFEVSSGPHAAADLEDPTR
ncbi:MAG: hypothetical protein QGH33_12195, partial [Pirellulaceae bacterium]|nr:hypothetical protein [Pirellulaceae bacterium]